MPATFDDRFTMPDDVPFTMPGDSVFATEDPDELLGLLWVAGKLDESTLPPERKSALAAWKQKLLARTARETGARVVEAVSTAAPASPAAASAAAPKKERGANGKFVQGNSGGPGNPFGRQVAELRARLLACAGTGDWETITKALIKKASTGDVAATKLVYQYTLGKPAPAVDPDRADIDEANLLEAARHCVDLAKNLIRTPPLETMLTIIHIMQEICQGVVLTDVKQAVDNGNRKDALRAQQAAKAAERREKRRAAVTQPHQTAPGEPPGVSPRVSGDAHDLDSPPAANGEQRGVGPRVNGDVRGVTSPPAAAAEAPACAVASAAPGTFAHPAADAARLAEPARPVAPPNGRNGEIRPSTNGPNGDISPPQRPPQRCPRDAKGRFAGKPNGAAPSPNGDKR